MAKCKVCGLPMDQLAIVEKIIRDDVGYEVASEHMEKWGVTAHTSAIARHKINHMKIPSKKKVTKADKARLVEKIANEPPPPQRDYKGKIDTYRVKAMAENLGEGAIVERRTSQLMLENILQNQLAIVSTMQSEFMESGNEYPRDQINGLKSVMDMVSTLPSYGKGTMFKKNAEADAIAEKNKVIDEYRNALKTFYEKHGPYTFGIMLKNYVDYPWHPTGSNVEFHEFLNIERGFFECDPKNDVYGECEMDMMRNQYVEPELIEGIDAIVKAAHAFVNKNKGKNIREDDLWEYLVDKFPKIIDEAA